MEKKYNVLLLDDNPVIADCIKKRLLKASEAFYGTTQIKINPIYLEIDITKLKESQKNIQDTIDSQEIHFLLLDSGFYKTIDPTDNKIKDKLKYLNQDTIYYDKTIEVISISEILRDINFSKAKFLKGVVLYTYDTKVVEPAEKRHELIDVIGKDQLHSDYIDIILTNSDLYKLAKINLYNFNDELYEKKYAESGKRSDFQLYGLFIGEILYHRILNIINKRQRKALPEKKHSLKGKLFLLFVVFTSLGIGSSAIYELAKLLIANDLGLFMLSFVFSFLMPFLILALKPELVIKLDDE